MSQPEARRSLGHKRKAFTKAEAGRMFDMRKDGHTDAEIARRFGCSASKVVATIGRRAVTE